MLQGPGSSGSLSFTSNGTVDFDWKPRDGSIVSVIFTIPTRVGTVQVFRVDSLGNEQELIVPQVVQINPTNTANDVQLNMPIYQFLRIRYTNTDSTAGTVIFDCAC